MDKVSNISFKGVKLYSIDSRSPERSLLENAVKDTRIARQIKQLEEKGLGFDIVRDFNHDARPTKKVNLWLNYGDKYVPKNLLNPIRGLCREIKTLDDAKKLIREGIKRAKAYLPEHLRRLKNPKYL